MPVKPIIFTRRQVELMCRFAGICDPAIKLESPDSPATQRVFNLKQNKSGDFVWKPSRARNCDKNPRVRLREDQQEGAA